MASIKLRLKKDGKPFKNDLLKARELIKSDLSNISKSELPKQLQGYYEQVKKARERIVIREPITGKILGGKIRARVLEDLQGASEFSGLSVKELLKPENYKTIFEAALENKVSFSGTLSGIDKYLQLGYVYGAQYNDGNGNVKLSVEDLLFKIKTVEKYLSEYGFFGVFYKGHVEADGTVTIFIDEDILRMAENNEDTTPEDIDIILNGSFKEIGMVAIKSEVDKKDKKKNK